MSPEALAARLAAAPARRGARGRPRRRPPSTCACRPAPTYAGDVRRLAADLRRAARDHGGAPRQHRPRRPPAPTCCARTASRSATGTRILTAGGRPLARLRAARRPGSWSSPTATSSPRRSTSTPGAGGAACGASSPTSATSRSGDLVVHEEHGIGRFLGLETLEVGGATREFMVLGYQGGRQAQGPGRELRPHPEVHERARARGPRSTGWAAAAGRRRRRGSRRPCATWPRSCCSSTPSARRAPATPSPGRAPGSRSSRRPSSTRRRPTRRQAIAEVAADMAAAAPMDRLVCGDVGYGKTEVAMRAAMRAVLDGKQVAVLAPTTVLAFQHWKTFRKRFAPFPVTVEMISRFRAARRRSRRSLARRRRRAGSTSSSAPTGSSRRTWSSATSASWSSTRSSASGSRPRRGSSTSRPRSTA